MSVDLWQEVINENAVLVQHAVVPAIEKNGNDNKLMFVRDI